MIEDLRQFIAPLETWLWLRAGREFIALVVFLFLVGLALRLCGGLFADMARLAKPGGW